MTVEITRIRIKNFKNLKDVTIKPKKFNVLIGPNGSGKTNFLEFFKLLRKIYVERNPYPFLEWDGYENVVWNHQRSLPIEFEIETVERTTLAEFLKKYSWVRDAELEKDLSFDIFRRISASFWADRAENLKILKEIVEIEIPKLNYRFAIERHGDVWKVRLNEKVYELNNKDIGIKSLHFEIMKIIEEGLRFFDFDYIMDSINDLLIADILKMLPEKAVDKFKKDLESNISKTDVQPKGLYISLISLDNKETIQVQISKELSDVLPLTIYLPLLALFKIIVLFSLNLIEIKYKRKIIPRYEPLSERGENALDILALTQLKEGNLPKRINYALENYFNGKGYFTNMTFYLRDLDSNTEFSKEHLPDGLIKLLVILTALEQNPNILLIDEIENSLHPELLEFVINVLREECEGCVFVTTHSPIVLNLVEPEEIFIFKPTDDGIEIKNLTEYKSKEEIMKELEELGITLGEKVLYGLI
jgi:AAA15 family ATPase/GTPase